MVKSQSLRQYIIAISTINPTITNSEIVNKLIQANFYNRNQYKTAWSFVDRTRRRGTVGFARRNRARPVTNTTNINFIKRRFKKTLGTTKCSNRQLNDYARSKGIRMSTTSCHRIIRKYLKYKAIKRRRTQRLKLHHKRARVATAKYLLRKYGKIPLHPNYGWDKMFITDMSKPFRLVRPKNHQNDIVYVPNSYDPTQDYELLNMVAKGTEKQSPGYIYWGAITSHGVFPKTGPVNFTKWLRSYCKRINKKKITLDNIGYMVFIREVVIPMMDKELDHVHEYWIFEDDADSKYRTPYVRREMLELFPRRIPTNKLCAKLADVWPIENVWGIFYERARQIEFDNLEELDNWIHRCWRQISVEWCKNKVLSIPQRLKAVIQLKGNEIRKEDYQHSIHI